MERLKTHEEEEFNRLADEWEKTHANWQLTHIENHPNVKIIVSLGKGAIPFVLEKLKNDRLWYIIMERIILNEFDEDLQVDYEEGGPEEISGGRYLHLEGNRQACLKWAEKNKKKYS